jgi:hypothetical protein
VDKDISASTTGSYKSIKSQRCAGKQGQRPKHYVVWKARAAQPTAPSDTETAKREDFTKREL